MAKKENSCELAATLVACLGTQTAAAEAISATPSQVSAWIAGDARMPGTAAMAARRAVDDFRFRQKALVALLAGRPPRPKPSAKGAPASGIGDDIALVVELWDLAGGAHNLLSRQLTRLARVDVADCALRIVRQTIVDSILPDPWSAPPAGITFYGRDGDALRITQVYVDDGNPPVSEQAWNIMTEV